MKFKLVVALVDDSETDAVLECGRRAGATGATIITSCRGEGLQPEKTFLGLSLTGQRDILLFVVEEHLSRAILEEIATVGAFDKKIHWDFNIFAFLARLGATLARSCVWGILEWETVGFSCTDMGQYLEPIRHQVMSMK